MQEILELVHSYLPCLAKCAIRQVGRFPKSFGTDNPTSAYELAEQLATDADEDVENLKNILVALCPREGSLVHLISWLYILNADHILGEAIEACVESECRAANKECRTFDQCFGTPARAKRTTMALVYEDLQSTVFYSSKMMNLYPVGIRGPETNLEYNAIYGIDGWQRHIQDDGLFNISFYRIYNEVLELILDPMSSMTIPVEDLEDITSIVLYGHADPDIMRDTVGYILKQLPGLKHLAAINMVLQEDSFEVLSDRDVNLPYLETVIIDVQQSWGTIDIYHSEHKKDTVRSPWDMASDIRGYLKAHRPFRWCIQNPKLLFRHDITKSDDTYVPCPGVIYFIY